MDRIIEKIATSSAVEWNFSELMVSLKSGDQQKPKRRTSKIQGAKHVRVLCIFLGKS